MVGLSRLAPCPFLLLALILLGCGQEHGPADETFSRLNERLAEENWVPDYFAGNVPVFNPATEELLLRKMQAEPFTLVQAGPYEFRSSPKRVEMGRRLFHHYNWGSTAYWAPSQRYAFYALGISTREELQERYGILAPPEGSLTGLVGLATSEGRVDFGWSCAICHAGPGRDGRPVAGSPNHFYNYGQFHARGLTEHVPRPEGALPGLIDKDTPVANLASLGPGRIDMNGDRTENPVKIPALWGLREIKEGMFANGSVGNLWLGVPHNGGPFPASELLEAVIAYVLSLEPPANPRPKGEAEVRGEQIFEHAACGACHAGPYYTNGEVIPLEEIGTDPKRARMELPKGYRVPTLLRLDLQRLFLHDGSLTSLPELFSRDRLQRVPGHEYGLDLSQRERDDLVAFLLSL